MSQLLVRLSHQKKTINECSLENGEDVQSSSAQYSTDWFAKVWVNSGKQPICLMDKQINIVVEMLVFGYTL